MKKRSQRRKHCALAVVRQKFSLYRRPLPRGAWPKFNQLEMGATCTYRPSLVNMMHTILSYRGNRPTNKQTHRQDRLQYTAPLSLACSVITIKLYIHSPGDTGVPCELIDSCTRQTDKHVVTYIVLKLSQNVLERYCYFFGGRNAVLTLLADTAAFAPFQAKINKL